jgi:multiple sugar transport system permease protein
MIPGVAGLVVNGLLLGAAAISLFPLLWMLSVSLMAPGEAASFPPPLVPRDATLANYRELFAHGGMARYLANSAVLTVAVTLISLTINVAAGYAFAKLRFAGRDRIFKVLLAALVIPAQVAMVPLFLLLKQLGLVNTYGGVIVPAAASIFGIFLVRQYALSIPTDLLEAARIDGANEFRIFWTVVMPLATPVLATLGILTFLGNWNSFIYPLVMAQEPGMYTLPVALATFATGQYQADHGMLMAGSVVLVVPVLIVFILFQRWITEGIATTGLKG